MAHNLFDLSGKFAFVTGATKGIGRSIAEAFTDHGATVVVTGRKAEDAEQAAAELNARAGREAAFGQAFEVTDLENSIASYDAAVARFGRIDIVVLNAAALIHDFGPAEKFKIEDYREMMNANVVNNTAVLNHAAAAMKERRDGVLLVTSSGGGVRPSYGVFPYAVSKAGLNFVVRTLAAELAPYNVRLNAVAPGLTMSHSLAQTMEAQPEVIEGFKQHIPLQRITQPEEIAAGMVFLASTAGRAMTGQVLSIDGGEPVLGIPKP